MNSYFLSQNVEKIALLLSPYFNFRAWGESLVQVPNKADSYT